MVKSVQEDKKQIEYEQVLAFWKWLKAQPTPKPDEDGDAPVWLQIAQSIGPLWDNDKPLLQRLLSLGVDYIQDEWRKSRHDL